ncbi:MAG: DNA cytosine methyltransferase [Burkholderiales bacterium]|jgi:DNA (cytosine-5)-methyltransferase 1|nr:DNA cytosine methyltransferase [Burkholderiales bacterium]
MDKNQKRGLLSVFCGAGGLDLGFEDAGFGVDLAFDIRPDAIMSYNSNRTGKPAAGHCQDVRDLTLKVLDKLTGDTFEPFGVIGGPPCQSFSRANRSPIDNDPRHELPFVYAKLINRLNKRKPLHFFVLENVVALRQEPHSDHFELLKKTLAKFGFNVFESVLDARNYGVPQKRERLILVGLNSKLYPKVEWAVPPKIDFPGEHLTVRHAFKDLPEPAHFRRYMCADDIAFHPNHWCMAPKSKKFSTPGALVEGQRGSRSFKTLSWDKPSVTVAYGNREVHIHPNCQRRLSVFEAMRLQGFPDTYELKGSLSSQITQVSEAVPPPMARAVAASLNEIVTSEAPKRKQNAALLRAGKQKSGLAAIS